MGATQVCKASLCKCNHDRKPRQNATELKKAIQYHLEQFEYKEKKEETEARVKKFLDDFEDHLGEPRTPEPEVTFYWQN